MKLHLPSPLRIALLACLAIAASCTTLATATLVGAAMASYSAQAADIYYDGGTISSWENGTLMGDTAFQSGDNLIFSGSTLQAANGTYVASVVSEGENTIQVASGTATFSGEVSGNGTLTKTGSGILALTTDIYHTGDLNITAGTVRFGMATQGPSIR